MRRLLGSLGLALAVAAGAAGGGVAQDPEPPSLSVAPESPDFVPGELLVRFKTGVTASEQAGVLALREARIERALRLPRLKLVRLPKGRSVEAAAAALNRRPEVAYAEPNWIYHLAAVPNDPRFGELWGLHQAFDVDIDAPEAWDTQTGSADVVVAVIDSGIAYDHPDLAGRVWSNPSETGGGKETDGVDNDGNGLVDDHRGYDFVSGDNDPRDGNEHGTHVAGTIGAVGNNALGVVGVNWDVTIMPLQACGPHPGCSSSAIVNAVTYADAKGADVVNMSIGGTDWSQAQRDAIAAAPDTLFVTAAGNENVNDDTLPQYPCAHPFDNIICVGAGTASDLKAPFSNFGAESVDLFAPGVGILSTFPAFDTIFLDDFEGPANWDYVEGVGNSPTSWERTTTAAASPTHSLTDSEGANYANGANVPVTLLTPFSLVGRIECRVDYSLRFVIESFADRLVVEAATSAAGPWEFLDDWDGSSQPPGTFGVASSDLGPFEGQSQVFLRFSMVSNGLNTFDGAYLDDVRVLCPSSTYAGTEYGFIDGTSMASPHVAGAAALLVAEEPDASPGQLKSALLGAVDSVPAFAGLSVAGGRLNVNSALAAIPTSLHAPPSQQAALDTAFDGDGTTSTPVGAGSTFDRAFGMARQTDGNIVVAGRAGGEFALARFNENGSVDDTFAGDGTVTLTLGTGSGNDEAHAVAVQPDGKIVAAGIAHNNFTSDEVAVVRFNTDGTLDTTFSDDGIILINNNFDVGWALALQGDGKVVVAGKTSTIGDSMVLRLNTNGTRDATFGAGGADGDGFVTTAVGTGLNSDEFRAVAVQPDGKLVAAGFVQAPNNDFSVVRYNTNGSLDTSFEGDGIAITPISLSGTNRNDEANAIVLQSDGKIVVAGESPLNNVDRFALARYNSDGSLDSSFSGDGKLQTSLSPIFGTSRAFALALQGDGKLLAAGEAEDRSLSTFLDSLDFAVARFNGDGSLDKTFNGDGKVTTSIAPNPADDDTAVGLALQPDGGIVAGGWSFMGASSFDFTAVRYKLDGDVEPPANVRFRATNPPSPGNDTTPSIRGSAEAGSTVNLYTSSDCTGGLSGTGSAASFLSPGFEVTVPDNTTTTFRATATDGVGNTSACSDPFAYVADSIRPETTITAGPSGQTADSTPTFEFSSEAGASFECGIDLAAFTECSSPHTTEELADGPHTFKVQATDPAGNVELTPKSRAFVVETAPDTTIDGGPDGPTNDPTPTFEFSSDDPLATFECRVGPANFADCTSPHTTVSLGDGPHTFEVRAVSATGSPDPTPASRSFTVDTNPPETTIDSGPSAPTNDATPTFEFSSDDPLASFECRVDSDDFADCTSPHTTDSLADGARTFEVQATDQAGNADPTPASSSFTVDTDPPETTIDAGTNGPTRDRTPEWNFSSDEAGATFECRLVPAAFAACTSPHETAVLADGPYTFEVRAKDAAGNRDASPATRSVTVDTDPPETTIDSGPANGSSTNDSTPTFEFSSEPGASFQCRVAPAAFATCLSPHTTAALADGARTFDVRATDAVGNTGAAASRSFTVDTDPPETTIILGPDGPTHDLTPEWGFTSDEPGGTFECRLLPAGFTACSSPNSHETAALADGPYTFEVRAKDAAGNVDGSPEIRNITVDTVDPTSSITFPDDGQAYQSSAYNDGCEDDTPDICGGAADVGSGVNAVQVSVQRASDGHFWNGSSWSVTDVLLAPDGVNPWTLGFSPGEDTYTVSARAVDFAGNVEETSVATFTVDNTAPDTFIDSDPQGYTGQTPTFEFSSNDDDATFGCRVDAADFTACSSPYTTESLEPGPHTFQVKAADAAGNEDASPAEETVTVDVTDPTSHIEFPSDGSIYGPADYAQGCSSSTPDICGEASDDAGPFTFGVEVSIERQSDGMYWNGTDWQVDQVWLAAAVTTETFWSFVFAPENTTYTVSSRAIDAAGNTQELEFAVTFTVDGAPPETTITGGPIGPTNDSTPTFTFTSEPGATFQCRLTTLNFVPCASPFTASPLPDGPYTFEVRAIDPADNIDPTPATRSFTVNTSPPPPPPPPPPPGGLALPFLTISDAKVKEGNTGTKSMVFLVKLSAASATPVTFGFATKPGTAKPKQDFLARRGTLAFAPGQTVLKLVVKVKGDRRKEKHEKFQVVLASAVGATIADGIGVGTIRNND